MTLRLLVLTALIPLTVTMARPPAETVDGDEPYQPHTPTLMFFLSHLDGPKDADAIRSFVNRLPSAKVVKVDVERSEARVRFDSHVVSYHQVAQAIAEAGTSLGQKYDPCLKITVPDYPKDKNAEKI